MQNVICRGCSAVRPQNTLDYIFKMEAYMSTLDPAGKGGEILRAAATEVKDMDDAEVANLAAIY